MKHAHDDTQLSVQENDALQQIQAGPQGGETVPVTRDFLRWLNGAKAPAVKPPEAAPATDGKALPAKTADQAAAKEEQINGSLFVKGAGDANEVDINDVQQGQVGDCYFVAVLAAIARVQPDFIKSMVKDNGDGTYTVTFHTKQGFSGLFGSRSNQSVTVDSKFWTDGAGNPVYAKKGDTGAGGKPELWVMVIEKAWAKLQGSYDDINGGKVGDDARKAVTGKDVDYIDPTDLSDTELTKKIEAAWAAKQPVIFWSHGDEKSKKLTKNGVVVDHEYALNAAGGGKFTLYNPWGSQHLTDVDVAFIKANFQKIRFLTL
jgi:hypothetical protein